MTLATSETGHIALAPEIRGWCPGAFTPMASNDGLLIRAKLIGSKLTVAQAREIATIAADCGNSEIDLSQRAQFQLRGVSEATLSEALHRLDLVGLLPRSSDAERITNIVAAPIAGLTGGRFDANVLANDLAQALLHDVSLRDLPTKFLFVIDDASGVPLTDVAGDIRLEAAGDKITLRIAGAPELTATAPIGSAVEAVLRLSRAFLALQTDAPKTFRRMRALVDSHGANTVFDAAGLTAEPFSAIPEKRLPVLGAFAISGAFFCGIATPFGRWRARDLAAAAEFAANEGLGELRLTPWRAILIPTKSADAALRTSMLARAHGFIATNDDLRLAVVACPGAPECPQAQGRTRNSLPRVAALAQHLAGPDGVGLHISGCEKGCARSGATPVTLVATLTGYNIIDNGRASDKPTLSVPTIEAAVRELAARATEKA